MILDKQQLDIDFRKRKSSQHLNEDAQSSTTDSLSLCNPYELIDGSEYINNSNTHSPIPYSQSKDIKFDYSTTLMQILQHQQKQQQPQCTSPAQLNDRFIPNRKLSKLNIALSNAHEPSDLLYKENRFDSEQNQITIADIYKTHILGISPQQTRQDLLPYKNFNIFQYKQKLAKASLFNFPERNKNQLIDIDTELDNYYFKNVRKIPKAPFKVLDAPALQDDFYLNLIDWNSQNTLSVGLASCVYLWSAQSSKVTKLCDLGLTDCVTSVSWSQKGPQLAIGTNSGDVQIWDSNKLKKVRDLGGHSMRVGTLAWNSNILTSGSRDKCICYRDLLQPQNYTQRLTGHKQEVCGLKWSFDEQYLASGGNDNKLFIWNSHSSAPIKVFKNHQAAVKALAWNPHQHGLLVSGGGTADRTIRFWNTLNGQPLEVIDTGSQVCNLMFSTNVNELVSTHGYSLNQIIIWSYPDMEKIATLTGHTYRVLYLAMSPDGQTIVTGAGDETLRFWNVFPSNNNAKEKNEKSKLLPINNSLR